VVSDGSQDVNRKAVRLREINGDELSARFHQVR
jgi:hypothetical protein